MKKILLMVAAIVALTMVSCQQTDYKQKGEDMAKQLDELCQQQNAEAVLALDDNIQAIQKELVAAGDTAGIELFRDAMKESRDRNAPYVAVQRVKQGVPPDTVVNQLQREVLDGNMTIDAVTAVIDAILQETNPKK